MLTLISFILILGILVLAHELGHFITAIKLGVEVEEFGIGFRHASLPLEEKVLFILLIGFLLVVL